MSKSPAARSHKTTQRTTNTITNALEWSVVKTTAWMGEGKLFLRVSNLHLRFKCCVYKNVDGTILKQTQLPGSIKNLKTELLKQNHKAERERNRTYFSEATIMLTSGQENMTHENKHHENIPM